MSSAAEQVLSHFAGHSPQESLGAPEFIYNELGFSSKVEMLDFLRNKAVLDVGSGAGGIARETYLNRIDATIISLNPRFAWEGYKARLQQYYNLYALDRLTSDSALLSEASVVHDSHAVAAFGCSLPFTDHSFNLIIDNKGAIYHTLITDNYDQIFPEHGYTSSYNPNLELLDQTLIDYYRVLASGGEARIGGIIKSDVRGKDCTVDILVHLDQLDIPYTISDIYDKDDVARKKVKYCLITIHKA